MGIETRPENRMNTPNVNGVTPAPLPGIEDALYRPFNPGVFCLCCWDDLHGSAYRVSFIGEPAVVSTPVCEACFPELEPDGYVYARRVEVRRG